MVKYAYRAGRVRTLKEGADVPAYLAKHPDAYLVHKPPCESTLEEWLFDSGCESLDGCWVEPDGECPHGKPSWLKALAWI